MKFYLAHPFELRREVRSIELWIEMTTDAVLVNPFYDLQREDMAAMDDPTTSREARSRAISDFKALVYRDLNTLDYCDAVVCVIQTGTESIGTICEAWEACILEIPTYFICDAKAAVHPWVRFMADKTGGKIFSNWQEFHDFLIPEEVLKWFNRARETAWGKVRTETTDDAKDPGIFKTQYFGTFDTAAREGIDG